MAYFAVYDQHTGDLVSTGTVVAPDDVLAKSGLASKRFGAGDGPPEGKIWNPGTKTFSLDPADPPEPTPGELLQALRADAEFDALTPVEQALVERFIARL